MKVEYLNEGNPLPQGHPHAGKIGVMIDKEDGTRPHRVYADNDRAMNFKLAAMYANTQARIAEVKEENARLKTQAPPAAPPPPAAPALSAERKMQLTSELSDPARAGDAVVELLKDRGIDLASDQREKDRKAELERLARCTSEFAAANPEYVPGPWGRLISDRAFSMYGEITTETLQKSFDALKQGGMLPSAALEQTATDDEDSDEPSAPTPQPPSRGTSTGQRPSQFGGGPRRVEPTPSLNYEKILEIASTPDYERRLREEPGFADQVNKAFADFERRTRRAG